MFKPTASPGDIFCIPSTKFKKWCAYQVTHEAKDEVALITLDWFNDQLPQANDIPSLKPLYCVRFYWNNKLHHFWVSPKKVPLDFVYIGNHTPIVSERSNAYTGWPTQVQDAEHEYIWSSYPRSETERFKIAGSLQKDVIVNGKPMSVGINRINEEELKEIKDWKELDQLPRLTQISYQGRDAALVNYIETRKLIKELHWRTHDQEVIDISDTALTKLMIDTSTLKKLILNEDIELLSLSDTNKITIIHPNKGLNLQLNIGLEEESNVPDYSLPDLTKLHLFVKRVDIAKVVTHYPELKSLSISGLPGYIDNIHALTKFKQLRYLNMHDIFGFSSFPSKEEMPRLEQLSISSFPSEVAKTIKSSFKNLQELEVTQPRTVAWLEANINNPFRSWEGESSMPKKHIKAAFEAYKKASTHISQLTHPHNKEELLTILKVFIETFNSIYKAYPLDTTDAEDINEAYSSLIKTENIKDKEFYYHLFDDLRSF